MLICAVPRTTAVRCSAAALASPAGNPAFSRGCSVYVFAGALPAGLLGLYIGWHTAAGPSVRVANLVGSALWLTVTLVGLRMARQRRFGEHRRWMSRSFALAMSIVLSRVINVAATIVLTPELDTTFGGSHELMQFSAASIGVWLSPLLLLLLADLMLERRKPGARKPVVRQVEAVGYAGAAGSAAR
jgi:hypothetical protein